MLRSFWMLVTPLQPFSYLIEEWEEAVQPLSSPRTNFKVAFHYTVHALLILNQFTMLLLGDPIRTRPIQLIVFDLFGLMGFTRIIHVEMSLDCVSLWLYYAYFHNRLRGNGSARAIVHVLRQDPRASIVLGDRAAGKRVRERVERAHRASKLPFSPSLGELRKPSRGASIGETSSDTQVFTHSN